MMMNEKREISSVDRYWLLTVLRPGEAVPSKVELRLARLYRTAFSRQQQRHLGLLTTDPRSRRDSLLHSFIGKKVIYACKVLLFYFFSICALYNTYYIIYRIHQDVSGVCLNRESLERTFPSISRKCNHPN